MVLMTPFFKIFVSSALFQLGLLHFQVCNLLSLFSLLLLSPQTHTIFISFFLLVLSHTFSRFCCLIWNVFLSSYFSLFTLFSFCPPVPAPLRAVSIFQTQRVFSRSCARVSLESQAVDGFGGEDPVLFVDSSWGQTGEGGSKDTHVHTANANTRSCSFQISLKEIEFDRREVLLLFLCYLCLVQIAICSSQVLTM